MRGKIPRSVLRILVRAESVMFMAIAVALVVIAVVVFARGEQFAVTITRAVNSALFIVVVLELLRTIVARLEGGGFQRQPFLVIGIISATRDIRTVGAELSLVGEHTPLVRTMTEVGVNAGGGGRAVRRAGSGTPVRPAGPGLSGHRRGIR